MSVFVLEKGENIQNIGNKIKTNFPSGVNGRVQLIVDLSSFENNIEEYVRGLIDYLLGLSLEIKHEKKSSSLDIEIISVLDNVIKIGDKKISLSPSELVFFNTLSQNSGVIYNKNYFKGLGIDNVGCVIGSLRDKLAETGKGMFHCIR